MMGDPHLLGLSLDPLAPLQQQPHQQQEFFGGRSHGDEEAVESVESLDYLYINQMSSVVPVSFPKALFTTPPC